MEFSRNLLSSGFAPVRTWRRITFALSRLFPWGCISGSFNLCQQRHALTHQCPHSSGGSGGWDPGQSFSPTPLPRVRPRPEDMCCTIGSKQCWNNIGGGCGGASKALVTTSSEQNPFEQNKNAAFLMVPRPPLPSQLPSVSLPSHHCIARLTSSADGVMLPQTNRFGGHTSSCAQNKYFLAKDSTFKIHKGVACSMMGFSDPPGERLLFSSLSLMDVCLSPSIDWNLCKAKTMLFFFF